MNTPESEILSQTLVVLRQDVEKCYEEFHYYQAIDLIMDCLRKVNVLITNEKPWELRKSNLIRLGAVLNLALDSLRISTILLQPITPGLCDKILNKLNIPEEHRSFEFAEPSKKYENHKIKDGKVMIFKKIHST